MNRDRGIPICRAYYVFALTSCHSATPAEWITRVVYLPQTGETTTAERDDLYPKSLFLVKKIKDNGTQKAVQRQRMGILLCEHNFRDVWRRNKSVGQKLVTFCAHTHTHTRAAKLVVRMKKCGARTLPCGRPFFCDSRLSPLSSKKKRLLSSKVRITLIRQ